MYTYNMQTVYDMRFTCDDVEEAEHLMRVLKYPKLTAI